MAVLPFASVVVTRASIVWSGSAARSAPENTALNLKPACTVVVTVVPFTVMVTVSPTFTSPPTVPVTAMLASFDSARLMTPSPAKFASSAIVAASAPLASL